MDSDTAFMGLIEVIPTSSTTAMNRSAVDIEHVNSGTV